MGRKWAWVRVEWRDRQRGDADRNRRREKIRRLCFVYCNSQSATNVEMSFFIGFSIDEVVTVQNYE